MSDLNLPADLIAFLQGGKQLEYDPSTCEAGAVTLLPLDQLKVQFFPMDCQSTDVAEQDPQHGKGGCYLVVGVNLIASCTGGYDPVGLLLWLPLEERYATWDSLHHYIGVFGADVSWSQIVAAPAKHINAQWVGMFKDSATVSCLVPWPLHPYSDEQIHHPLPDRAEWYEATWTRLGAFENGVRVRFPEEIQLRLDRNGNGYEISSQVMEMDETGTRLPAVTTSHVLTADEGKQVRAWLEVGFWEQPKTGTPPKGETATMWSFKGYRGGSYHTVFRSYDDSSSDGDVVHEMGKRLAHFARLQRFNAASP